MLRAEQATATQSFTSSIEITDTGTSHTQTASARHTWPPSVGTAVEFWDDGMGTG